MISRFIDKNIGPFLLRISLGMIMLIAHGLPKLFNYSTKKTIFLDPLGVTPQISLSLVIFSEVICSLLLIIGFKTRIVTIPLIITMAVAAFVVHAGQQWSKQELAIIYLIGYVSLFFSGGGRFALKD